MSPWPLLFFSSCLLSSVAADVITGIPDAPPPGFEQWFSEIVLPAKPVSGDADWAGAVAQARAFVNGLSLEEKVNLTTGVDLVGRCVGQTGDITRLGFAGLCMQDSPLGVRFTDLVSAFPTAINVATTWDKDLIRQRGQAMGAEHRGKGVNVALGPMTNMGRVAAGGRNWEGFGADPFLSGVATRETILGMQSENVIACVKHYVGNEQEHFRGGSLASQIQSSNIDDRTMHEVYAWPFADAVQAGVGSVMCSYNKVNQTQACQNSKILNGILKEELDFQGFIVSDWAAMINGVQPALAGLDMDMPGFTGYGHGPQDEGNPDNTTNSFWGSALIESVRNGSVPEARVDDMATRIMSAFFKMGQDQNYPPINFDYNTQMTMLGGQLVNEHVNVQDNHAKLICEIGAASTILLKNVDGALPLNAKKLTRISIFGSDAGPNPDGPNGCADGTGDRGCSQGTLAMGWGSGTAQFPYLIDPLSAIQSYVRDKNSEAVIEGVLNDFNYARVAEIGPLSDICLVFVNADSGEGYITVDGNAGDRTNITLWHGGEDLIAHAADACPSVIVVQHVVGPVLVEDWIDNDKIVAVLHAGLPGQESGNGLVDVLFGDVNPSGRLPYTVAKQRADYPADIVYTSSDKTPQITYEEGLHIDYRHFDANSISPRFEFGFGLSYTQFEYHGLKIHGGNHNKRADDATSSASPITPTTVSGTASSSAASGTTTSSSGSRATTSSAVITPSTISASSSANATTTSSVSSTNATTSSATTSAPPAITSPAQHSPGGPTSLYDTIATVTYTITNTGKRDGHEVSQVYLSFPDSTNSPPRVLRGFERTWIKHGKTETVKVDLRRKDVSVWDVVKQMWVVPDGKFGVHVGSSSRDLRLSGTFTPSN